jgi:hypothetical protein
VRISRRPFMQVGVLVLMTIALALSAQAATYSKASLKGSYSFLTNLWTANASSNQFAMVGVLTFNGAGAVTGSYTSTDGGVVKTGTLGGTYTVNSNGTGTITFTTGSTAQFAINLDSTAAKVAHGVQLLQTNDSNNEIVSGTAVLQSTTAETYSVASLKGSFSSLSNLWMANASATETGVIAMISFDGKGNFKGPQTGVFGNGVVQTNTVTGTYAVNPDGSGSLSTANGTLWACALNTVAAGKAKGAQCLVTELNGHSLGDYTLTGIVLSAQATKFSNASLKGSYSFLTNLWTANVSTSEFAMVGVLTFNGAGTVTGSYTSVTDGVVQTEALGGTYTVNSDGTGTITFTTGSTAQFAITLSSIAAKVAHGVQLLQTNVSNNEIVSGTAVFQSTTAETYSVASMKGNFADQLNMWTADVNQALTGSVDLYSFDGKGNLKDSYAFMEDGVLHTGTRTGTYTVNPDGSGSLSTTDGFSVAFALNSVAAGQAKGLQLQVLSVSGNYVKTGTALKQ